MSPEKAVRDVLKRIERQTVDPRLLDEKGRPDFNVTLYTLRKDGAHASGSIWNARKYAVNDGGTNRHEEGIYLYRR